MNGGEGDFHLSKIKHLTYSVENTTRSALYLNSDKVGGWTPNVTETAAGSKEVFVTFVIVLKMSDQIECCTN